MSEEIKDIETTETMNEEATDEELLERFDEKQINQLQYMLNTTKDIVKVVQELWDDTKSTYRFTPDQIEKLYNYNKAHLDPKPEGYNEENLKEGEPKYDDFNGIDKISEDEVIEIFGRGSEVIGITHDVTKDRLKSILSDFVNWVQITNEYNNTNRAFLSLMELKEESYIKELTNVAEKSDDPNVKEEAQKVLDGYCYMKYLQFLKDPEVLDDTMKRRLKDTYTRAEKTQYIMNRTLDKIERLNMNKGMLFVLNNFEKRFLDEKYHKYDNLLLLYTLQTIAYCDPTNNDKKAQFSKALLLSLDALVRGSLPDKIKEEILQNIKGYEDIMIDYLS